jgi:hypothetical protein
MEARDRAAVEHPGRARMGGSRPVKNAEKQRVEPSK